MICVYCDEATFAGDSCVAHVVPHAVVGSDDLVLPRELAHSKCDQRLKDLDVALLHCEPIYWQVANAGVANRRGKPKQVIGDEKTSLDMSVPGRFTFTTKVTIPAGVHIPADKNVVEFGRSGPAFDEWKFVRSIHKVGLLTIARHLAERNAESRIRSELGDLRRYVCRPTSRAELWSYGYRIVPTRYYAVIGAAEFRGGWLAIARLFGHEFLISSRNFAADATETLKQQTGAVYEIIATTGRWSKTAVLI